MDAIENRRKGNKDLSDFKVKYTKDQMEDIMSYNDIMNHIHRDRIEDGGNIWKFCQILGHTGPLDHRSPGYKNSLYNLEIEWENGEITFEPLSEMIADDAVTVAKYAKKKDILDTKGWKKLRRLANRTIKLDRLIKQAKLRSFRTAPKYMYGFKIPSTYEEALAIDKENNNTKWADATALEMLSLIHI